MNLNLSSKSNENRQKAPAPEHAIKLSAAQREATVKRWPVRHTAEMLGDRALVGTYNARIHNPTMESERSRSVGSNVMTLAAEETATPDSHNQPLTNPLINAVSTPLDEQTILKNIDNIHNSGSWSQ